MRPADASDISDASDAASEASRCPVCAAPNDCCMTAGAAVSAAACWCARESFPAALLDELSPAERGRRCVCRRCLRSFEDGRRT